MNPTYPRLVSRRLVAALLALVVVVTLVPTVGAAERWIRIGKADHTGTESVIDIGGRGPFDALRLRVKGAELALESLQVSYTDGTEETLADAMRIPAGADSPALAISDGEKRIQSVSIRGTGNAKLVIEGLLD